MENESELKPKPIERGQRSRPKYGEKGNDKPRDQPPFRMTVAEKRANAADDVQAAPMVRPKRRFDGPTISSLRTRFSCSTSFTPGYEFVDYVIGTSCNFCIAALIWVIIVHVIIGFCQLTQLETVKQLSSRVFDRASRL